LAATPIIRNRNRWRARRFLVSHCTVDAAVDAAVDTAVDAAVDSVICACRVFKVTANAAVGF
jgi:hypothetical protein